MNRQKQIEEAAIEALNTNKNVNEPESFVAGAFWADANPDKNKFDVDMTKITMAYLECGDGIEQKINTLEENLKIAVKAIKQYQMWYEADPPSSVNLMFSDVLKKIEKY